MTATRKDLEDWLEEAQEKGAAYLIIGHDWWDHDNFPIFCQDAASCTASIKNLVEGGNRYDEVYDMSMPIEDQLSEHRAMNKPDE